jgi:hypothetical protein
VKEGMMNNPDKQICSEVRWRYNFLQHLTERCRGWQEYLHDNTDFVTKIAIDNNEAEGLEFQKTSKLH